MVFYTVGSPRPFFRCHDRQVSVPLYWQIDTHMNDESLREGPRHGLVTVTVYRDNLSDPCFG